MRKSRLNSAKQAKLTEHFAAGTTARCAADLISVNHNTAAYYFQRLRKIIVNQLEQASHEVFAGEIEVDESYFGGTRKDVDRLVKCLCLAYSSGVARFIDVSYFRHYRINHSKLFADKRNHINGIENFWNQAKRHMRKFNGVPKANFELFLKECEWRFNNPTPQAQLV